MLIIMYQTPYFVRSTLQTIYVCIFAWGHHMHYSIWRSEGTFQMSCFGGLVQQLQWTNLFVPAFPLEQEQFSKTQEKTHAWLGHWDTVYTWK